MNKLPPHLSVLQILELIEIVVYEEDLNWFEVIACTRARRLCVVMDLWTGDY